MKKDSLVRELIEIVRAFSKQKGLVIGDVILDEYVFGRVQRISPEAPVPVVTLNGREVHLGGAANVALNLKDLGVPTFLVGVVGEDVGGREIQELLKKENIPGNGIVVDPTRKTTIKTRVVGRGQQMLRIDNEQTEPISEKILNKIISQMSSLKDDFEFIIFEDYNKGLLSQPLISSILSKFKDKLKAVDPKFENFFSYIGCEIVKPNLRELQAVTGTYLEKDEALSDLFIKTKEALRAKWLVVTRGEIGFVIVTDKKIVKVPAWRREVFDVTGAGDTVISVLTLAAKQGAGIVKAAILASLAAGIEVGKFGASTVLPEELFEAIEENAEELEKSITISSFPFGMK